MGGTEGARGGMEGGSDDPYTGKGRGRIEGGRDGGSKGREGGGGSDDVRQRGSGSGGREVMLREGFFIHSEPYIGITPGTERARKGRNEAWTERGKERRD